MSKDLFIYVLMSFIYVKIYAKNRILFVRFYLTGNSQRLPNYCHTFSNYQHSGVSVLKVEHVQLLGNKMPGSPFVFPNLR